MSRGQARRSHWGVHDGFIHDAKERLAAPFADNGVSHDSPHLRHTPDLESDSDPEEVTTAQDPHSAVSNGIVPSAQGDEPILTGLDRTGPRVRFRSRVRISAGIGPRRRRLSDGLSSNASSISGSPSSSISAPLRTHYTGSDGWSPLGSRVKVLSSQPSSIAPRQDDDVEGGKGVSPRYENGHAQRRCKRSSWTCLDDDVDENTHLLTSSQRHSCTGRYAHGRCYDDREREWERQWREQVVDETFGKWPARLFNRHWWWWRLESIVCCFCEDDEE